MKKLLISFLIANFFLFTLATAQEPVSISLFYNNQPVQNQTLTSTIKILEPFTIKANIISHLDNSTIRIRFKAFEEDYIFINGSSLLNEDIFLKPEKGKNNILIWVMKPNFNATGKYSPISIFYELYTENHLVSKSDVITIIEPQISKLVYTTEENLYFFRIGILFIVVIIAVAALVVFVIYKKVKGGKWKKLYAKYSYRLR